MSGDGQNVMMELTYPLRFWDSGVLRRDAGGFCLPFYQCDYIGVFEGRLLAVLTMAEGIKSVSIHVAKVIW